MIYGRLYDDKVKTPFLLSTLIKPPLKTSLNQNRISFPIHPTNPIKIYDIQAQNDATFTRQKE
jgi:hypothetical protein